jgi:hypothetical protein
MKASSLCAVAGFIVFGLVCGASADTIDVSFTGTLIGPGYDQTGIFGLGGTAPISYTGSGISYAANFVFNTALGASSSSPTQNSFFGGTSYGVPTPLVNASVTINGRTANIPGQYASEIFACSSCQSGSGELYASAQDKSDNGSTNINNMTYIAILGALPASITSGTYSSTSDLSGVAHISFLTASDNPNFGNEVDTFFEGSLTSVTETVTATPLPGAWSVMSVGLAFFGFLTYRRTGRNERCSRH